MYRVRLTSTCAAIFSDLHPKIKTQLKSSLKELYKKPYLGKSLRDELIDFRSLKMKRYRAIYQVNEKDKEIIIFAIGHRKNIYESINRFINER